VARLEGPSRLGRDGEQAGGHGGLEVREELVALLVEVGRTPTGERPELTADETGPERTEVRERARGAPRCQRRVVVLDRSRHPRKVRQGAGVTSPLLPRRAAMTSLYDLEARTIHPDREGHLTDHRGKVALVVNVASACGYTPQYAGLEALQRELAPRGFTVLAFPCNQFGAQEPGGPQEIATFCRARFDVTFPVFEKVEVTGNDQSPVFAAIEAATGAVPRWNFAKALVGRDGAVVGFYESRVAPDDDRLREDIERALGG
jgi:glutathione peroxidase